MNYPTSYHAACNHLVAYGGHGGNRLAGRRVIARALWDLRRVYGRARAMRERRHLLFIAGQFPVKHDV